ncbi:MAG: DUF4416 family protein [Planctomycetota bacterium]|nr:DUF4416 family protein [Planctomycetota bacterium]
MAVAKLPEPARFFVASLCANGDCHALLRQALAAEWGEIDLEMGPLPFQYTSYYTAETGPEIIRAFFGFAADFDPGDLAARKLRANALEQELAKRLVLPWPRPVNIDPGYLTPDKVVLASCKDFAHRLYLRDGVYAEITLFWRAKRFQPHAWTFPDYRSGAYDNFFVALRQRLLAARRRRRQEDALRKTDAVEVR